MIEVAMSINAVEVAEGPPLFGAGLLRETDGPRAYGSCLLAITIATPVTLIITPFSTTTVRICRSVAAA
jgi:hypothetical protein